MTLPRRLRAVVDVGRAITRKARRYPADDKIHAPGHRHRGPAPVEDQPKQIDAEPRRHQGWIRTSHSDSQTRRFRR